MDYLGMIVVFTLSTLPRRSDLAVGGSQTEAGGVANCRVQLESFVYLAPYNIKHKGPPLLRSFQP